MKVEQNKISLVIGDKCFVLPLRAQKFVREEINNFLSAYNYGYVYLR